MIFVRMTLVVLCVLLCAPAESGERALVKEVLVKLGLEDRVFRLEAVGTREPARPRAIEPAEAEPTKGLRHSRSAHTVHGRVHDRDRAVPRL